MELVGLKGGGRVVGEGSIRRNSGRLWFETVWMWESKLCFEIVDIVEYDWDCVAYFVIIILLI